MDKPSSYTVESFEDFQKKVLPQSYSLKIPPKCQISSLTNSYFLGTFAIARISDENQRKILESRSTDFIHVGRSGTQNFEKAYLELPLSEAKKLKSRWKGYNSYIFVEHFIDLDVAAVDFLPTFSILTSWDIKTMNACGLAFFWHLEGDRMFLTAMLSYDAVMKNLESAIFNGKVAQAVNKAVMVFPVVLKATQPEKLDWLEVPFASWHSGDLNCCESVSAANFEVFYNEISKMRTKPLRYAVREEDLMFNLMPYQREAVRWMIGRELDPQIEPIEGLFDFVEVTTDQETLYYFQMFGVFCKTSQIDKSILNLTGGILADEMGLGKTVEVIALLTTLKMGSKVEILEDDDENEASVSQANVFKKSRQREPSEEGIYQRPGSSGENRTTNDYLTTPKRGKPCEECNSYCDVEKLSWKPSFQGPFYCPQCITEKPSTEIKTTLIIVPESLTSQWYEELQKHISRKANLKVMYYYGLWHHGFMHPQAFNEFDIVITTYETLNREFRYADRTEDTRPIRNKRARISYVPTPLIHIKWWRVCIDESQAVEDFKRQTAQMCAKIESRAQWCITGTPLVKSLEDIYGLLYYLSVYPYCVDSFWKRYLWKPWIVHMAKLNGVFSESVDLPDLPGHIQPLMAALSQIMWRNTKLSIIDQMKLPPINEIVEQITFTAIEERQYKEEISKIRAKLKEIVRNKRNDTLLSDLGPTYREKVLTSLHAIKDTLLTGGEHIFGRGELLDSGHSGITVLKKLIRSKKTDLQDRLREVVCMYNALAGVYWAYGGAGIRPRILFESFFELDQKIGELNKSFAECLGPISEVEENELEEDENDVGHAKIAAKALQEVPDEDEQILMDESIDDTEEKDLEEKILDISNQNDEEMEEEEGEDVETVGETRKLDARQIKAKEKLKKLVATADRDARKPVRIDAPLLVHMYHNLLEVRNSGSELAKKNAETILDKSGDLMKEMVTNAAARYCRVETRAIQMFVSRWAAHCKRWSFAEYSGEFEVVKRILTCEPKEEIVKMLDTFHQFKDSLDDSNVSETRGLATFFNNSGPLSKTMDRLPFDGLKKTRYQDLVPIEILNFESREQGKTPLKKKEIDESRPVFANDEDLLKAVAEQLDKIEMTRKKVMEFLRLAMCLSEEEMKKALTTGEFILDQSNPEIVEMSHCDHALGKQKFEGFHTSTCAICRFSTYLSYFGHVAGVVHLGETYRHSSIYVLLRELFRVSTEQSRSQLDYAFNVVCMYFQRLDSTMQLLRIIRNVLTSFSQRVAELRESTQRFQHGMTVAAAGRVFPLDTSDLQLKDNIIAALVGSTLSPDKLINELRYMMTMATNEEGRSDSDCPICLNKIIGQWVVYPCAHVVCEVCYGRLRSTTDLGPQTQCVVCRAKFNSSLVSNVRQRSELSGTTIEGRSLSAKLDRSIVLIRKILHENPMNKIIVFTTVNKASTVMKYIQNIFKEAALPYISSNQMPFPRCIAMFRNNPDCLVLLCSMIQSAQGLNLAEANHIIFLDPCPTKSLVAQAIGRINRIGQTKEMFVYHLLVKDSIDYSIYEMARKQKLTKHERGWTIGDISIMFELDKADDVMET
ncbi:unnamed protein product [Caenorhabditis auriculariae]|uniref:RING-type domain-containing protein n=1 Tax=Caenorhabditis auriculariae TaxID=2777116 RepID=A0A8S1HM21_9PELO|nr:unnamed protein product [Caenorhabditis auriculariae]